MSRADDLRALSDADLGRELEGAYREAFNLRFRAATRQLENVRTVRKARRDVARIKTILRERQLTAALAAARG